MTAPTDSLAVLQRLRERLRNGARDAPRPLPLPPPDAPRPVRHWSEREDRDEAAAGGLQIDGASDS